MQKIVLAAALLVAVGLSAPASAQQTPEQACTPDAFRLCQQFIPDRNRVRSCLTSNVSQLSPACRAVFAHGRSHGKARRHTRRHHRHH